MTATRSASTTSRPGSGTATSSSSSRQAAKKPRDTFPGEDLVGGLAVMLLVVLGAASPGESENAHRAIQSEASATQGWPCGSNSSVVCVPGIFDDSDRLVRGPGNLLAGSARC